MSSSSHCPRCFKEPATCICSQIVPISNQIEVLILQHPQEARSPLTTSPLIALALKNCTYRVGLSWRSLKLALGKEASSESWAVLFVGTKKSAQAVSQTKPVGIVDKKGKPRSLEGLQGLIVLDGNWKQSKTLWWRNPWLLKLNRIVLNPALKSLYGNLREEPREGLLSSIEATALALEALGETSETKNQLFEIFEKQVKAWKK